MSDQIQSNAVSASSPSTATGQPIAGLASPLDHWEEWPTFRAAFLRFLPPDVAEDFRRVGRALYDLALGSEAGPHEEEPWLTSELRAAAADTAFAAHFLHGIAAERHTASLDATEARLAAQAEVWSVRAAALAAEIEAALPPRPGDANSAA